LDIKIDITLK